MEKTLFRVAQLINFANLIIKDINRHFSQSFGRQEEQLVGEPVVITKVFCLNYCHHEDVLKLCGQKSLGSPFV